MRVPSFDYHLPGPYFITICTQNRCPLFGSASDGGIQCSAAGDMVAQIWSTTPRVFPGTVLDAFVVMPNHFHAILTLNTEHVEHNPTLGDVVKWFKTLTTVEYAKGVALLGWTRFPGRLWQHLSYDHIVHNDVDCYRICAYIKANPSRWGRDDLYVAENPAAPDRTATRAVPTNMG